MVFALIFTVIIAALIIYLMSKKVANFAIAAENSSLENNDLRKEKHSLQMFNQKLLNENQRLAEKMKLYESVSLKDRYSVNPKIKLVRVAVAVPVGEDAIKSRSVHKKLASKIGYRVLKDFVKKSSYEFEGTTRCGVEFFLQDNE